MVGRKYFTYILFAGITTVLYPCPYSEGPGILLTYTSWPHEPAPDIAVSGRVWPPLGDLLTVLQPSGSCLIDIFSFDPPPPQSAIS